MVERGQEGIISNRKRERYGEMCGVEDTLLVKPGGGLLKNWMKGSLD